VKKTVWMYGLISGAVCSVLMIGTLPFENKIGFDWALLLGYTTMVLAFLLVFFGIRSYREHQGEGRITFLRGFTVGILITLISCVCYVATWEVIYFKFMPDFMDKYGAHMIERARASGASAAAIQALTEQMKKSKEMYDNPFFNAVMTFIEPFPVGLVMTLISALLLRKKAPVVA
jgi:amino acid transporter